MKDMALKTLSDHPLSGSAVEFVYNTWSTLYYNEEDLSPNKLFERILTKSYTNTQYQVGQALQESDVKDEKVDAAANAVNNNRKEVVSGEKFKHKGKNVKAKKSVQEKDNDKSNERISDYSFDERSSTISTSVNGGRSSNISSKNSQSSQESVGQKKTAAAASANAPKSSSHDGDKVGSSNDGKIKSILIITFVVFCGVIISFIIYRFL